VSEIGFVNRVASHFPALKGELRTAHLPYTTVQYISRILKVSTLYSVFFTALSFFVIRKAELSLFLLAPAYALFFFLIFRFNLLLVKAKIKKRERDIDREVLFIGRYLLVKLYSGRPLLNALVETSSGRGIAAKYVKEIVDDIGTGNTIEDALSSAMIYSPSDKLRKILFHINNALQLGIDVTRPLEQVLDEITRNEELEIKKYGKKLNTLVIIYMLAAVVVPSLGTALFIVISSFLNFPVDLNGLMVFVFFVVILQFIFITLFRSIRPIVDL